MTKLLTVCYFCDRPIPTIIRFIHMVLRHRGH